MLRIGLLLTGAGATDGSDPLQVVAWRIAAAQRGHVLVACAPDVAQHDVVGLRGVSDESRHALTESARLASGVVERVESLTPNDLDALVVPGGLGAVKTLCTAAVSEPVRVLDAPKELALGLNARGGALVACDEAIVWLGWVFGEGGLDLATDGRPETTDDLERLGHRPRTTDALVRDAAHRILTRWLPRRDGPAAIFTATTDLLEQLESSFDDA